MKSFLGMGVRRLIPILAVAVLAACGTTQSSRLLSVDQVRQVQIGQSQADVVKLLGEPSSITTLGRGAQRGDVWTYDFLDPGSLTPRMQLFVHFPPGGDRVRRVESATNRAFDPGGGN